MHQTFDYVIIGSGMAGTQLALALADDAFFQNKKIALIDPDPEKKQQKTWSFWEKSAGKWNDVVFHSWKTAKFHSKNADLELSLQPYHYKMLKSQDFYAFAQQKLSKKQNFHFFTDKIDAIDRNKMKAMGRNATYKAAHFFDSRLPKQFFKSENHTKLQQHFLGWFIETEKPVFNTKRFTMMDFRLKWKETCSFTYVLPVSETKALVEFTFFSSEVVADEVYEQMLKRYVSEILNIENFRIVETEKGNIPMTDFPFQQFSNGQITKIGTGGGWVKASTGYSFKNTERKVAQLIGNIKEGKNPGHKLFNQKFGKYDSIFLDVLQQHNHLGEQVFEKLYTRNRPQQIFKYLDEETAFPEDLNLMLSLYSPHFIKSFFRKII